MTFETVVLDKELITPFIVLLIRLYASVNSMFGYKIGHNWDIVSQSQTARKIAVWLHETTSGL